LLAKYQITKTVNQSDYMVKSG